MRIEAIRKKNSVKAKKIIVDSIKDHLLPQVSSLKTPKEMFNALTKLFEGKNINQKLNLRNQLKDVKIQNVETIQAYFTRDSQIKEQHEEVENTKIVITTLNGLLGSWDSFIRGMCARRK